MRSNTRSQRRRGYTLVEILVVVTIIGIAGSLVVPTISQAGVLRSQASVRAVVADIAFAQSDAIATQQRRAILFDVDSNSYAVVTTDGGVLDRANAVYDPFRTSRTYIVDLDDEFNGEATLTEIVSGPGSGNAIIFDEFGAPVDGPASTVPIPGGRIELDSEFFTFTVRVDGMTGLIRTERVEK